MSGRLHPASSRVQRRLRWDALRLVRGLYGDVTVELLRSRYGVSRATASRWAREFREGDPQ